MRTDDAAKRLGDMARKDIRHEQSKVKRRPGESDESVAARLYDKQMEVYSAYAMRDLWTPFYTLPKKTQDSWLKLAKEVK